MTTQNGLTLSYGDDAPEAPQSLPVFKASLAGASSKAGFRFDFDEKARRSALSADLPDIEAKLRTELEAAYWQQLRKRLKEEAENFEKFFKSPSENFGLLGIVPEGAAESFNAATAFAGGFSLTDYRFGNDVLTIEPSKITILANPDRLDETIAFGEYPVEGVLASIALALKNPNFKNKPVTITGDDDLVAFAYAAYKAAGIEVKNSEEIEAKLQGDTAVEAYVKGKEAWDDAMQNAGLKTMFEDLIPELRTSPEEPAAAPEADADTKAPDAEKQPAATEPNDTGATEATALDEARKRLPEYTAPEGVESYEFYNQALPEKTVEGIVANYSESKDAPKYNDVRALASVRLFHGEEKQKEAIVGQALFRALATLLKDDTMASKEAFLAHLKSGRIQATEKRAEELAETLYEPLKAYIASLPTETRKIFGTEYPNVKILPDFTKDDSAAFRDTLVDLVECQHNTQNDIREHFVGTRDIVERLLKNSLFMKYAVEQITENRLNQEAGIIAKKALGTELKFEVTTTDVNGAQTDSKQTLDTPYEVMQMLIAADRLLSMHPDSVGLVSISKALKSSDDNVFPLGKGDTLSTFTLREALGSQYAANLARALHSQETSFTLSEWKAFNKARVGMAYITAREGIEILNALETDDAQVKEGVQRAKNHLGLIIEAAKTINPDIEGEFPDTDKSQRAQTKGRLITQFEQHYAAIGHKVSPQTLGNNIAFLTKFRNNTEATLIAENFAGLSGEYIKDRKPEFKMRLGL